MPNFFDPTFLACTQFVSLSPEVSLKMTFGSNTPQEPVLTSPSQLLAGQGYLIGRLTHDASWPTLIKTLEYLLDKSTPKERYVLFCQRKEFTSCHL